MKTNAPPRFSLATAGIGFRPEFLDFRRGIHVGNLEENERITRILKLALEARYRQGFITARWGRGVFWQWIGFLPRANRDAKPVSSRASFGCSKFFVSMESEMKVFKIGLQVERGYLKAPRSACHCQLHEDWDWHRLMRGLRPGTPLERELRRLIVREGFSLFAGSWDGEIPTLTRATFSGVAKLRRLMGAAPGNKWAGFQLYYPMGQEAVQKATGLELVESMLAVCRELTPIMNLTMQVKLDE